jgi:hypothetical protein
MPQTAPQTIPDFIEIDIKPIIDAYIRLNNVSPIDGVVSLIMNTKINDEPFQLQIRITKDQNLFIH